MGLAEKRAIAKVRDEVLPTYQTELRETTGSDVSYVVDWDSCADDMTALENLEDKCLKPLTCIFQKITRDDLGKEAVKESIREIHLSHGKEANIPSFSLPGGVLKLPWDWSGWPGSFYPDSVQEKIESML